MTPPLPLPRIIRILRNTRKIRNFRNFQNLQISRSLRSLQYIFLCGLLVCCDADERFSRKNVCRFYFDNHLHNNSIVASALNPLSPGVFMRISMNAKNGLYVVSVNTNIGESDNITLTTSLEEYRNYTLGANNGIIVGYSSLGDGLLAFDAQCPVCAEASGVISPTFPLTWDSNGQKVKCNKCTRTYDLNSSNNGLWQYPASCTGGPYGRLAVSN